MFGERRTLLIVGAHVFPFPPPVTASQCHAHCWNYNYCIWQSLCRAFSITKYETAKKNWINFSIFWLTKATMVDRTIGINKIMEKLHDFIAIEWVQINCAQCDLCDVRTITSFYSHFKHTHTSPAYSNQLWISRFSFNNKIQYQLVSFELFNWMAFARQHNTIHNNQISRERQLKFVLGDGHQATAAMRIRDVFSLLALIAFASNSAPHMNEHTIGAFECRNALLRYVTFTLTESAYR